MTKVSTILFGGCSGVGLRSIRSRILDIGFSKGSTTIRSVGDCEWKLETKYFVAKLILISAENPEEALNKLSGADIEVSLKI